MVAVATIVAFAAVAAGSLGQTDALPRIHSSVHRALRAQGTVNLVAKFKDSIQNPTASVHEADFADRGSKIAALVSALEVNAVNSQREAAALLAKEAATTEPLFSESHHLWISNMLIFKDASFALVEKLSALESIVELREEKVFTLPEVKVAKVNATLAATAEWGVQRVKATNVWAAGNTGQNVIVGHIDSGVLATHETLRNNRRSTYSWFDPEKKAATPYDSNGHGTHTMSTIAGSNGVGVAPGATWISCKGCRGRNCPESDLLTCGQWMTCPTDTSGNNKDCSKAPHLVSNSLGGPGNDPSYQSVVDAWLSAGIIPVFANGNEGPACSTAGSPGDYTNVIAVGATDINDGLADFSSRGPAVGNAQLVKPDISGPGVDIRAAWNTGNTDYNTISGTSMATPHVSGVVALLLNAKPGLSFQDVRSLLTSTTNQALQTVSATCGGTGNSVFPNNQYGWGLIDAAAAIKKSGGVAPTPTTKAPTQAPTVAPTQAPTVAPTPTTKAPVPTTKAPVPTTKAPTPKPTTSAPTPSPTLACSDATTQAQCAANPNCTWFSFFQICF